MPVKSKEYNCDRAKGYQCYQSAQQPQGNEVAHCLYINCQTRHELPRLCFVMKREAERLQVIVEAVSQIIRYEVRNCLRKIALSIGAKAPQ